MIWIAAGLNTDFLLLPPWVLPVVFGVVFGWFARGGFVKGDWT